MPGLIYDPDPERGHGGGGGGRRGVVVPQPVKGTTKPVKGTTKPVKGTTKPVEGTTQPGTPQPAEISERAMRRRVRWGFWKLGLSDLKDNFLMARGLFVGMLVFLFGSAAIFT